MKPSPTTVETPEKPLDFWEGPEGHSFRLCWRGRELGLLHIVNNHLSGKNIL
jgi:hypothetical protein